jgi:co-chaperonin GroES (HSP10)
MLSKEETEDRVGFTIPQDYWNFVPWGNRLLVRRFPKDKMTMGGLIIPNSAQKAKAMGVIVAVGHTVGMVYEPFQNPGQAVIHDDFPRG